VTGIATVCLRRVAVWDQAGTAQSAHQWRARPRLEWGPYWEYGAFVDVRDVAAAAPGYLARMRPRERARLTASSRLWTPSL
jgi:hypothetical protein